MKNAHKLFDRSQAPIDLLHEELTSLARRMVAVSKSLDQCGINGCDKHAEELRGAAKMVRQWAKRIND